ncbi:TMEM175 family protein [Micromonospora inositola]|uniref:Uncharacterized membrane protein n=1 Tax=Micromonospora inositola TaxID=47865 RepID=A0A1C5HHU3_9ACTN|nr:TMEM175 family protein [Micromonospora inositola]SCG45629.1 Uncharacterized membrane protein [Micromonospora inositola]
MPKYRIEVFSDAVMAIIITLLVLDLRAPEIDAHATLHEYLQAMTPLVPKFVSFALSFTMVAIFWVNHYYFFRRIKRATGRLVWLNNLLLFWLCLLPFPTQFLGEHPTDQIPVMLYGVDIFFCGAAFQMLRWHASRAGLLEGGDEVVRAHGPRQSVPSVILSGLSIVLTLINVHVALACLVLVPLLYFVPQAWRYAASRLSALEQRVARK